MAAAMRLRILIVEDYADVRDLFVTLFETAGHHALPAADGLEGVARALRERPHAATVDLDLPDIDGHEVAQRLRRELGRDLILIAVTGRSEPGAARAAMRAGFDVYVPKPVDAERLLGIVEGAARRLRGCPACGETLTGPFPEHLVVCSSTADREIDRARRLAEEAARTQKQSRQLVDEAAVTRAEADALRDRTKKAREEDRPSA
ncbi:MAG TPA: response regulator [Methylomirabilota bacterium]|jgi:CheY-like chemotaxis protein|nr:response regulator [Methylomirabilota bacterium]